MASVDEGTNEKGVWYTARGERGTALSAFRENERSSTPFTVFWHGRTNLLRIFRFVSPYFSLGLFQTCDVLAFTRKREIRRQGLTSLRLLWVTLPYDTRFVRIECIAQGAPDRLPALVVWSRLDLARVPLNAGVPDEIGVYLFPLLLPLVSDGLGAFIQRTHAPRVTANDVADCLKTLAEHLHPAPDHRPTYA